MKIEKPYDIIILTEGSDPIFQVVRSLGGYKVASALRNEGFSVFVLNNFTHWMRNGTIREVMDKLMGDNTLWVGFSSTLFMRNSSEVERKRHTRDGARNNILWHWPAADEQMLDLCNYIREKGAKTVYGGQMTDVRLPLVRKCVDYYVVGMGEIPAIDISYNLRDGKTLPYNIAYGKKPYVLDRDRKGEIFEFRNAKINYVPEDFWAPDDAMGIEFGRGCIFKCKFCSYPLIGKKKGDETFLRAKEMIKHELQQNYDLYGTTKYVIIDDTFNEQTIKLQAIADAIDELDLPPLQFSAFIRIDLVARDPYQVELLKKINVCAWFLGIESLNPESARAISKGIPKDEIFNIIKVARQAFNGGLSVYGSFITGLPFDTRETMDEWTLDVIYGDHFDAYSFSPLELGTDSILSQECEKYGYINDPESNKWSNDYWTSDEAVEYTAELQDEFDQNLKVSTFFLMFYQCLGFTFDELRNMTIKELFNDQRARDYSREYMEKHYYSKVENFLGMR